MHLSFGCNSSFGKKWHFASIFDTYNCAFRSTDFDRFLSIFAELFIDNILQKIHINNIFNDIAFQLCCTFALFLNSTFYIIKCNTLYPCIHALHVMPFLPSELAMYGFSIMACFRLKSKGVTNSTVLIIRIEIQPIDALDKIDVYV